MLNTAVMSVRVWVMIAGRLKTCIGNIGTKVRRNVSHNKLWNFFSNESTEIGRFRRHYYDTIMLHTHYTYYRIPQTRVLLLLQILWCVIYSNKKLIFRSGIIRRIRNNVVNIIPNPNASHNLKRHTQIPYMRHRRTKKF